MSQLITEDKLSILMWHVLELDTITYYDIKCQSGNL